MSDSLRPHGLQHARLPCPSPTPGAYTNSCPLSWWCNHLILCHPLLLPPSILPSISLIKWVSSPHQVAKVLEFQLQHQSFLWIFRTDCFRMGWLDLLAVQGTLKSLLQHHSSKASIPFSSHLQSFPASGSFPMNQFFTSCGLSIGVSALASVLPMNIQDWFPLGLTGLISLQSLFTYMLLSELLFPLTRPFLPN